MNHRFSRGHPDCHLGELPLFEKLIMDVYFFLKSISLSEGREFGLDTSIVTIEKVPLLLTAPREFKLEREEPEEEQVLLRRQ